MLFVQLHAIDLKDLDFKFGAMARDLEHLSYVVGSNIAVS